MAASNNQLLNISKHDGWIMINLVPWTWILSDYVSHMVPGSQPGSTGSIQVDPPGGSSSGLSFPQLSISPPDSSTTRRRCWHFSRQYLACCSTKTPRHGTSWSHRGSNSVGGWAHCPFRRFQCWPETIPLKCQAAGWNTSPILVSRILIIPIIIFIWCSANQVRKI